MPHFICKESRWHLRQGDWKDAEYVGKKNNNRGMVTEEVVEYET
jgi:hypothetical protein